MYSKCLNCQNPGRECLKRLLTMTGDELLIWCKARKKSLGLSNADIASATNVPKGTVDRLLSSSGSDVRFSTIQPIIRLLSGCTDEEFDCSSPSPEADDALTMRAHDLEGELTHTREIMKRLEESLASWKRAVQCLLALCALLVVALMFYIYMDVSNESVGLVKGGSVSPLAALLIACVLASAAALMILRGRLIDSKKEKPINDKRDES